MTTKKVLFISYFFPPLGGGGVIRTTKFVKYLSDFDWHPLVLTVKKGFYPLKDTELLKEVNSKARIWRINYFEPGLWFKSRYWQSFWQYLIYPWFFIPDSRILWVWPGLFKALKIIRKEKPAIIFTSYAPASDHLIGLILKKIIGIKWVADFRDEWSDNPFIKYPTPIHRFLAGYLEKKVIQNADWVISVSPPNNQTLKTHSQEDKFSIITNGFDKADFNKTSVFKKRFFDLVYTGTIYRPKELENIKKVISDLNLPNLRFKFFGPNSFINHKKAMIKIQQAGALLFILSDVYRPGVYTGKLFEYLATGKPILAVAPANTMAAKLIKKYQAGEIVHPGSNNDLKTKTLKIYQQWFGLRQAGINNLKTNKAKLDQYERRNLTKKLAKLFDNLYHKIPDGELVLNSKIKLCLIGNLESSQNQKLVKYFLKNHYRINFISTKPFKLTGVKTYYLGNNNFTPWYFMKSAFRVRQIIKKIEPDIVHGQDLVFGGIWAYLAGFRPMVVTVWGTDVFGYQKFVFLEKYLVRKVLLNANLVTGTSLAIKDQAEKIGMAPDRYSLVHFGIDLNIFKKEKIASPKKIIFCPRAIGPIYNTLTLVQAFAKLALIDKKIVLALLENIQDEQYLLEVEKLIIKYNLVGRVVFWPKILNEKIANYYNKAEVIVSLSSSDGCSVSFLEAMALEKKIVVTDLPYIKEWFSGNNLWQVPVRNIPATVKALSLALKYPAKKWQKIGQKNRELIAKKAEINDNFQKLDKLYKQLLN